MIFEMSTCGGCRTCEMACSFKHEESFMPAISRIKIIDKKDGPGFLILLAEKTIGEGKACDGCKEFPLPLCIQYCREAETLKEILEEFAKKRETKNEPLLNSGTRTR